MLIVLWQHRRAVIVTATEGGAAGVGAEKRQRRQFPTKRYSIPKSGIVRDVVRLAKPKLRVAVAEAKKRLEIQQPEPKVDEAKKLLSAIALKLEERKPQEELTQLQKELDGIDHEISLLNQLSDLNDLLDNLYLSQLSNELGDLEAYISKEIRFREDEEHLLAFLLIH